MKLTLLILRRNLLPPNQRLLFLDIKKVAQQIRILPIGKVKGILRKNGGKLMQVKGSLLSLSSILTGVVQLFPVFILTK